MPDSTSTVGLTPLAERALISASAFAQDAPSSADSLVPLLYGLASSDDSAAGRYLGAQGITPHRIEILLGLSKSRVTGLNLSEGLTLGHAGTEIVSRARSLATSFDHSLTGTEHLLLALVEYSVAHPLDGVAAMDELPQDPEALRSQLFGA